MADIVHDLQHALAHPDGVDAPPLFRRALEEIVELRFRTAPRTVRQGNAAAVLDSNTRKSDSAGLSADDPL